MELGFREYVYNEEALEKPGHRRGQGARIRPGEAVTAGKCWTVIMKIKNRAKLPYPNGN